VFRVGVQDAGLKFRGFMGYEGHLQKLPPGQEKERACEAVAEILARLREQAEAAGIPVEIVSTGGTGSALIAAKNPAITEIQAGTYLIMEAGYRHGAPDFFEALSLLATIISTAPERRIILDCGMKALSGERGMSPLKQFPNLRIKELHAEHGILDLPDDEPVFHAGDRVEIAVQYSDLTIHLHRRIYLEVALAVLKSCTDSSLPLNGELNQLRASAEDEEERNLSPNELACVIIQRELVIGFQDGKITEREFLEHYIRMGEAEAERRDVTTSKNR
jgi:D-serine deaminase-like pyridoxal phosphate-dependent protein